MYELIIAVVQTGGASLVALGLGVAATKIFAVVLGPAGIGFVSLVRQTYQSALVVCTLNGQTAMAQGIAARPREAQAEYLSSVFWILGLGGGAAALAFLVFPSQIVLLMAGRQDQGTVLLMRLLSLVVLAGVFSTYCLGILNGHRAVGRMAMLQIAGAAAAAALAYPVALLLRAGYPAALAAQLGLPVLASGTLGLLFVMRGGWMPRLLRGTRLLVETAAAKDFFRLAAATLLTGIVGASIPLAIRAVAAHRFGLPGVGIFDVAWTISVNYVLVTIASFSAYYIPSLSRLSGTPDRQDLVHRVLRLSVALMVPLVVATTVLKPVVVRLLYSAAFLPALEVLRWMLIGDYFRVTSWVFSFTMIAYADVKTLVWTEVVWGALTIGGAVLAMLSFNSLQGVGATIMVVYLTYLAFTSFYVRSRRHFVPDARIMGTWLIGLGLVVAASAYTWSDLAVRPGPAAAYIAAAVYFSWAGLTAEEKRRMRIGLIRTGRRDESPSSKP